MPKIRLRFQEFFVKVDFPEFWDRQLMNVIWGLNNFLEFWKKRIRIKNYTEMRKIRGSPESYKSTNQNKSNIFIYIEVSFHSFKYLGKVERFKKIAWIRSHHLHLQWKFQLLAGKFAWSINVKHCWDLSINFKSLLTRFSTILPLHPKQTFPPLIFIFIEGEGDEIESRLSS